MDLPTRFILENRAWADEMSRRDPAFFQRMTDGQQPGIFWIGCADSRVPAELITHAVPGELFVHRSIANMVEAGDVSLMSALQYAIEALKVNDVVVCGHDRCGGIRAALLPPPEPPRGPAAEEADGARNYLAERIRPLRALYARHRQEVDATAGAAPDNADEAGVIRRVDRLVALNVSHQVRALAGLPLVRQAWNSGHPLRLHGWIYGLETGYLRKVLSIDADGEGQADAA
jgi:carbonic anhydrase